MTTEMSASDYLRRYHESRQDEPDWRRIEKVARTYRPDAQMERLLALSDEQREALFAKAPSFRTSLGYYRSAKAAHEQMEARTRCV